jgi:hypothetical protein
MSRIPDNRERARRALPLLATLLLACGAAGADPLQITQSEPQSVTLRLTTGDAGWRPVFERDGQTYHRLELPDFVVTGEPRRPAVPALGTWLVLPPGTRAVVSLVEADWEPLDGRLVAPAPTPVLRPHPGGGDPVMDEEFLLPGETAQRGVESVPAGAAADEPSGLELGAVRLWRGHRIVPVTIRPLDVGEDLRARRLLKSAAWTVGFEPEAGAADKSGGRREPDDVRFGHLFLNGDVLSNQPREAAAAPGAQKSAARREATLLGPEIRVPVTRTGLFRLRAGDLLDVGLLPAGVTEDQLRLYQRRYVPGQSPPYDEIEVPVDLVGDGGAFAGDDALVFYGLRPRDDGPFNSGERAYASCGDSLETWNPGALDPVNNGNIYYLAAAEPPAQETWARMPQIALPAAQGEPAASYRRVDLREEDTHYVVRPFDANVDRYAWNSKEDRTVDRDLGAVNPAPAGAVTLRAGVLGYGATQRTFNFSLVRDATPFALGSLQTNHVGAAFNAPAGLTGADLAGASLRVSGPSSYLAGYLDWFEITYDALYRAQNDALDFHAGDAAGQRSLAVGGFTGPQLWVYDVSDPRAPQRVETGTGNVMDAGDGTWTLSLEADQGAPGARRFAARAGALAAAVPAVPTFKISRVATADDPLAAAAAADVLVVAHADFRAEAERWAAHRNARSPEPLSIAIVDVHAIYDWYGGGLKNPRAIKRLIVRALEVGGPWALQIFGDGSENVRGLSANAAARDFVPAPMFRWTTTNYENEMNPVDEWYATPGAGPNYPYDTATLPELLVGRFPCNSVPEAAVMIDKVIGFEASTDAWKKRSIMVADDAWSDGYDVGLDDLIYQSGEQVFETSLEEGAVLWESFADARDGYPGDPAFEASRVYSGDWLDLHEPFPGGTRSRRTFRAIAATEVVPVLLSRLGAGCMVATYQGHANDHLLSHEQIIEDVSVIQYRQDVASLANVGRPFVFIGLGCHVSRWARDISPESNPTSTPSLGEKMLRRANAGAVGVYASPGYEYRDPNAALARQQARVMLLTPPLGPSGRSRWVLGELLASAEASFLAASPNNWQYRLAVAQFSLLGDALMVLDAGPPRLDVRLDWDVLEDGAAVKAQDAANTVVLAVKAFDEAGIDRLVVTGVEGASVTATRPAGATSDQRTAFEVRLPVPSQDATAVLHVYDTAAARDDDPHATFTVRMPVSVVLYLEGELYVAGETPFPSPGPGVFTGRAVSAAFLPEDAVLELLGRNIALTGVTLTRIDAHTVDLAFTATRDGAGPAAVVLLVDGRGTEIPLEEIQGGDTTGIADLMAFPNPAGEQTRFVFATDAAPGPGSVLLFTVGGRLAARLLVDAADFVGGGRVIVPWDARDGRGDRLANGVYLYRVELSTATGVVRSDMQRLVLMR